MSFPRFATAGRCANGIWAAVVLAVFAAGAAGEQLKPVPDDPKFFAEKVQPFLARHCFQCHGPEDGDSELKLHVFRTAGSVTDARETWEKVFKMLRSGKMPPKDEPRPPREQVDAVVAWLDVRLNTMDCTGEVDPGRVTIRRLNRIEYQNTVRDLLGVEFQVGDDFPLDDVGYGFDNIGDVLTLSPILMEKYLAAAEKIAEQAIVVDAKEALPKQQVRAEKMESSDGARQHGDGGRLMYSTAEVYTSIDFARGGEYLLRLKAFGQQAGDEPARMALKLDGRELRTFDVTATEAEPEVYEYRTRLKTGKRKVAAAFVNDYYNPQARDRDRRDRNLGVLWLEVVGPLGVAAEDYPQSHQRIFFVRPGKELSPRDAASKILSRLASRAYRRPSTETDVQRLLKLFDESQQAGEPFEQSVQFAVKALLVSPNFLFKVEQDPAPGAASRIRSLSEYELATRMSYFLWSSMPDERLLDLAWKGQLRANLEGEVRRMLADERSQALVDNFAAQWLQIRNLDRSEPDRRRFEAFSDELRRDMATETLMFFASIKNDDRSLVDLLDADYTFVNERLARLYELDDVKGNEFRRVSLKGSKRGGVITQASVLTVTSNPTRTSPVKRGKWILENLLGAPPPPPPANVPELEEGRRASSRASLRERMEIHRENPNCAVCHREMDALGFALENFDAIGEWRTRDGRFDIDPSGELPGGKKFQGIDDLKRILVEEKKDEFVRCLTEKMLTYALGRGLEHYDRCAVDQITGAMAKNENQFSTLVLEIVRSEPFQKRRGKPKE